ncbi:tyrosine-type recombinase/integrase [Candidatus Saccharibacteria bacterium]|nr:tyrosine-type recombinase/integrase [Candidatus Saccharibacteria bacterium]
MTNPQKLDPQRITLWLRDMVEAALQEDEQERLTRSSLSELEQEYDMLDHRIDDLYEKIRDQDWRQARPIVDTMLEELGVKIDSASTEYLQLCRRTLQAQIHTAAICKHRTRGNYDFEVKLLSEHYPQNTATVLPDLDKPENTQPPTLITDALAIYLNEGVKAKGWRPATRNEYETSIRLFIEIKGDLPLTDITRDMVRDFRDKLGQLPPNREKKAQYRGKSIQELLAMPIDQPMSARTVQKNLERFSAFLRWAQGENLISNNPAEGIRPAGTPKGSTRKPFTNEDLNKLFKSKQYLQSEHKKPHHFWLPLLGLYTGARLGELCQLRTDDIIREDDVWMLHITDDNDSQQQLKTAASRRKVPVHRVLLDLGFIDYVQAQRARNSERIFPELRYYNKGGFGKKPTEWFSAYRKSCGVTDRSKVFHSFRHTLITKLSQVAPKEHVQIIVGHSDGSVTYDHYFHGLEPKVLYDVIDKLDYAIDLSFLKDQWRTYLD